MHDLKKIEQDPEAFKENISKRKFDISVVEQLISKNSLRKEYLQYIETRRADVKLKSKEIGGIKKSGGDASEIMQLVSSIKSEIEDRNNSLVEVEKELNEILASIPNLLDESVPVGDSEDHNIEDKKWGTIHELSFTPKDHVELGEDLGMLDFERGAKLTGARFVVYKGLLAKLERALINYMLDEHTKHDYEEIIPPFIVNSNTLYGTGQLPKFEDDLFKLKDKDWYLIPTAEVPLTNLKNGELFSGDELPIKYCAYTPCFRSEAGSHGKDTKGLIRLHQFNKVELVNIVHPDKSAKAHMDMVDRACSILEALKLPYRSVLLCSGDIGFGAKKCFDLEVWLPGQDKYREISSISNCGDFQARRASIRFRDRDGKPQFAHTLNGSGLAVGRTLVAILENYQNDNGTITVPAVLLPYMGGISLISKK